MGKFALIRVMVVEDEPTFMASFTRAILSAEDMCLVGKAERYKDALSLIPKKPCDVLLVDLGLPDGSGIDLIRAMRTRRPDCQAMVTTIFADETHVLQSIAAGATGYLLKDSRPEKIVEEIRSLHQGGSPISPLIARRVLSRLADAGNAPAEADASAYNLSTREEEVLRLFAKGFTHDEISSQLTLSRHTVLTFVRRIYAKLEVNSKIEAINEARRIGLIP